MQYISITEVDNGIPFDKVKEFIHQATDLVYGSEDLGPESLRLSLTRTQNEMTKIANTLEKGEYDFDGTTEEKVCFIWRPPSLNELTLMIFNMGLTHLGLEASIYIFISILQL